VRLRYAELDREVTPQGTLTLERYENDAGEHGYQVALDGAFLMASHGAHSERALAPIAHARLGSPARDLVALVGGLGAGHTLRATLDLPGVERVVVAEIGRKVVDWNRTHFAEANGRAVFDPRVTFEIADLADVLARSPGAFDLLLLDVDNGPGWLAAPGNARLYDRAGVELCRRALAPGGACAVWSPCRNPGFFATFGAVFPGAEELDTRPWANEVNEPADVVYVGVCRASARPHREFC
jgi:spermidine synthase